MTTNAASPGPWWQVLVEQAPSPAAAHHWWIQLHAAFDLPGPEHLPDLDKVYSDDEQRTLRRYCTQADALAASEVLYSGIRLEARQESPDEELRVTTTFPATEPMLGFAVLFRQMYAEKEPARFRAARKIVSAGVHRRDATDDASIDVLRRWLAAEKSLLAERLETTALRTLRPGYPDDAADTPRDLIEQHFYGGDIHWDAHRDVVAGWDEFERAFNRMEFFKALTGLTHLYIGFALVVRRTLGEPLT